MRIVVDLPAPLAPRKPKISPSSTSRETPSTAVKAPKRLVRPSSSTAAAMLRPYRADGAVQLGRGEAHLGERLGAVEAGVAAGRPRRRAARRRGSRPRGSVRRRRGGSRGRRSARLRPRRSAASAARSSRTAWVTSSRMRRSRSSRRWRAPRRRPGRGPPRPRSGRRRRPESETSTPTSQVCFHCSSGGHEVAVGVGVRSRP